MAIKYAEGPKGIGILAAFKQSSIFHVTPFVAGPADARANLDWTLNQSAMYLNSSLPIRHIAEYFAIAFDT